MIIIIADDKQEKIGRALHTYYQEHKIQSVFVSASHCEIKPCYACGGCTYKTYGKCVVRDDMDGILPDLMKADVIVYISPILWGGVSYPVKLILDKVALMGSRFYKMRNGELSKGCIGNAKRIFGIGVNGGVSEKEQKDFKQFIREISIIIDVAYDAVVVSDEISDTKLEKLALEVVG